MGGSLAAVTVGIFFIRVQRGVTKEAEERTMIDVRALFRDHVDGGAFGAAIFSRESLRADFEFLDSFQGKLHYRAADRVVLVVDPIDRNVDIAAAGSVYRDNRVTVLGRVIGIGGFHTRR